MVGLTPEVGGFARPYHRLTSVVDDGWSVSPPGRVDPQLRTEPSLDPLTGPHPRPRSRKRRRPPARAGHSMHRKFGRAQAARTRIDLARSAIAPAPEVPVAVQTRLRRGMLHPGRRL